MNVNITYYTDVVPISKWDGKWIWSDLCILVILTVLTISLWYVIAVSKYIGLPSIGTKLNLIDKEKHDRYVKLGSFLFAKNHSWFEDEIINHIKDEKLFTDTLIWEVTMVIQVLVIMIFES